MSQEAGKQPVSAPGSQDNAAPATGANQPAVTPATTAKEIATAFQAVFGDVRADVKQGKVSLAKRLAPYRKQILLLREAGKSWKAIAAGMRDPRIGQRVTPESLKAVFGPEEDAARDAAKAAAKV